jgi:hypothetical protein
VRLGAEGERRGNGVSPSAPAPAPYTATRTRVPTTRFIVARSPAGIAST